MTISFDGRTAIVTGAGNGLGRCHARDLAALGANVIVNDLGGRADGTGASHEAADAVVAEIKAAGGRAVASYESVATPEGGAAIVETALEAFGRLDILINNAGIVRTKAFLEQTTEDLDRLIDTHLKGAFYVTQPAFRVMKQAGYGRILFVASSATFGMNWSSLYGAAKGGQLALMRTVAVEGKPLGILSNAIIPGAASRMGEDVGPQEGFAEMAELLGRFKGGLQPDFVSPMALYLVSEACTVNSGVYSAIAGRFARVFTGITRGWQAQINRPESVEAIASHWSEIEDRHDFYEVSGILDETRAIAESHAKAFPDDI